MIGDNYLHVQRWRHNFVADSAKITSLPAWVRFPWLSVEYYTEEWLWKAGNSIGKTIKIDDTTLATARGRFARVCVEIDLDKPLVASYRIRGREGQFQYEGLQDLCFSCGKHGHREVKCPLTQPKNPAGSEKGPEVEMDTGETSRSAETSERRGAFGPWMVAQKPRRRQARVQKGISGNTLDNTGTTAYEDKNIATNLKDSNQERLSRRTTGANRQQGNQAGVRIPTTSISSERGGYNGKQKGSAGSRFEVLEGVADMDTDKTERGDTVTIGGQDQAGSDDDESCEEVVMETMEGMDTVTDRVKVAVSHDAVAEHLRPLGKTAVEVRTQDQEDGGPKNMNSRVLKEVTNKIQLKPTIAKASRSITKSNGAQYNNKQLKILKRPGEGIKGPPNKSPFELSASNRGNRATGSDEGGRPPDPPDISMDTGVASNSPAPNREPATEHRDERARAEGDSHPGDGMETEEEGGGAREVEEVVSTQF